MQTPQDVAYLESAIKNGEATVIMDMIRQMDDVVHALGIADEATEPVEAINKLLVKAGLPTWPQT